MPRNDRLHRSLGRTVRALRDEAELSQEDLGELAGLSRNTISAIELGQKSPTLRNLAKIARVLEVPVHELLREAEEG